ncbi:unnamed protein product [Schistosoma mattheei]|uniref:Uncharacterized protein n=1 Tax=Schistosoma mattheei TaxID=31246 RepID=A0A183PFL5_9TREM|nr:unnamed protein product [Schistosoma mattheei]
MGLVGRSFNGYCDPKREQYGKRASQQTILFSSVRGMFSM